MAQAVRRATRAPGRTDVHRSLPDLPGGRPADNRHPLVALAIVLPCAAVLAVAFGGWDAVVTQASSVAGMLGR
ncbi:MULTISPECIES: hypothetical protein [Streptomyces]|uniref:hypothetical protein n=1 Tax=Streptomyces TaxID=1883 RepID=UPI00163C4B5F|nr:MULTISPECIES: hypothetical protein [Streptomyces]MBC2879462.1 hypothetical protein [Streptomyces sp. TYQ1024]UBI39859.1 hypothetical protein K7I03_27550 [Streptomyces mobaraensis]UKW32440.1 hypothetical protein MCU78_27485 [Streptomyces sp. TYQ1024]